MNYSDARSKIQTGDLIAVKGSGFIPFLIKTVTRSPYSHVAMAIWVSDRLLLAQSNYGSNDDLIPLSQISDDFDVYDCPVDRTTISDVMWTYLGKTIPYDLYECFRIALYKLLNYPLPKVDATNEKICSTLITDIYKKCGWTPNDFPSVPWPGSMTDALGGSAKIKISVSNK